MSIKWNSKIQFPTDSNFITRIIDCSFGPSKGSQNPMITLEHEVLSPEVVDVGGEQVEIAGVSCKDYYVTQTLDKDGNVDVEKTENNARRCKTLMAALFGESSPQVTKFNPENPDISGIKGKCLLVQMSPDVTEQRKNPTSEQIAKAKAAGVRPEGDIMKNPVTGKALISYWPKVREVFGIAPQNAGANKPY